VQAISAHALWRHDAVPVKYQFPELASR